MPGNGRVTARAGSAQGGFSVGLWQVLRDGGDAQNVAHVEQLTKYAAGKLILKVECPTGSGTMMTLFEVAQELSRRLASTFLRDGTGHRPVYGGSKLFQEDPHWRDPCPVLRVLPRR
jgi:hypothetical protein